MKVSATELGSDSNAILDRVIDRGEAVDIQRHGKTVAELRPKVGVTREELARILGEIHWTEAAREGPHRTKQRRRGAVGAD